MKDDPLVAPHNRAIRPRPEPICARRAADTAVAQSGLQTGRADLTLVTPGGEIGVRFTAEQENSRVLPRPGPLRGN